MKAVVTEFGAMETHCGYIFEGAKDIGDIESFDWPCVDWFDFTKMNTKTMQ